MSWCSALSIRTAMLIVLSLFSLVVLIGPSPGGAQPLQPHTPFLIGANENFTSIGGVTGNGSAVAPYIISDLNITTSASVGIHIVSTRKFFIIRHVLVQGTNSTGTSIGIFFDNIQNGKVDGANVTGFTYGVQVSLGTANAIQNSNLWKNKDGIYLSSSNTLVSNNQLYNNTEYGATVASSNSNTFTNNNSSFNGDVSNGAGFLITGSNNLFDHNTVTGNSWFGIKMVGSVFSASANNVFSYNNLSRNGGGICQCDGGALVFVDNATANLIIGNYIHNQLNAIGLETNAVGDFRNNITMNRVVNNNFGIYIVGGAQNIVYDNYFNNNSNAFDNTLQNSWNTTKRLRTNILGGPFTGGNFFADYTGVDANGDGIGDTSYSTFNHPIPDMLPLVAIQPTTVHDVAALGIKAQPSTARTGTIIMLTVTAANFGTVTESFNVTLSYNQTRISSKTLANIPAFSTTSFTSTWDTAGLGRGTYVLESNATRVPSETYTSNNLSPISTVILTVNQPPVANFTINNSNPFAGDSVMMNAATSYDPDGTVTAYSWDFGDGTTSTGITVSHIWNQAGNYNVTLTVTDNEGAHGLYAKLVTTASDQPSSPLNFQLSATTGKTTLTWDVPATNGGSPIAKYVIYRASSPSGPWTNIANATTNNYSDTSVVDGQTYYYQVAAANQAGFIGQPSSSQNVLVPTGPASPGDSLPIWLIIGIPAGIAAIIATALVLKGSKKFSKTNTTGSLGRNR